MSEPAAKKPNMSPVIGTHDGAFHCDEALACYLLKKLPVYKEASIVRTRNPETLAECDIVVDVGAVHDHSKKRYDHHQRDFTGTMFSLSNGAFKWTTKLSSAGLVYFHYGKEIIAAMLGEQDQKLIDILYDNMYENFVEEIDAIDNGVNQYDQGSPKYRISSTISARVGRLNPSWREESPTPDENFKLAMELVGSEFSQMLNFYRNDWMPARKIVEGAIEKRFDVHESGAMIELPQSCPWKVHLFQLEEELAKEGEDVEIKYALFTDARGKWRVMCVPVSPGSFTSRKPLPEAWRGIRDQALSDLTGIPGGIFVHASGFIGGNETREGALAMAVASLKA